ncbi:MAG: serine/threonine-protein kinase PknK [Alphaproteobacteria bacterium]|nr:serine/threonine-protein kinase PknK [Alphaproteobacteria bacterium]
MSETAAEIQPGTKVGPYVILQPLGKGAQARVYVGQDSRGRHFAIKVRRRGQDAMDRRFLREFESMRLLRLPGVVHVHEAGIEEEYLWFSMDIVKGRPFLLVLLEEADIRKRVRRSVELGLELMTILARLHEAGFVHRDVKPSNILVGEDGHVCVLDFGIGRYFANTDTLSQSGEILGTVPYMAPEQLAGLPIDAKIDVFASATMLWESISGKRPKPLTTIGWIPRICLERLEPLAVKYKEVPLDFSRLLQDMLAVDPIDRPDAAEAASRFQAIVDGTSPKEWPTPPFVDPGEWWTALEAALGRDGRSPVWVLEGPAGTGKRRIAEQLHRTGLMSGIWPIHLRCRVDEVGGPLEQFLERLTRSLDDASLNRVIGDEAEMLRRMWPHLGLAVSEGNEPPSTGEIAASITQVVRRCADHQPLLIVVHDLERVDTLTARALVALAKEASETLGMVVLHEKRWETALSRRTIAALTQHGAQVLPVPKLPASAATELVTALCPNAPPRTQIEADTPEQACEIGWQRLARWRGEAWIEPPTNLWPLAVRDGRLPLDVVQQLVGEDVTESPWVTVKGNAITLDGQTARELARVRMGSLTGSARQIATALEHRMTDKKQAQVLAAMWLLAGEAAKAWNPAAEAAIQSERHGHYAQARRLLLLLDTLPVTSPKGGHSRFEVSFVQGRVALRTDVAVRSSLVEFCEHLAESEQERLLARILRAEYALREGQARPALVASLRVASAPDANDDIQVRALLVAIQCRIILGQVRDALRELKRVEQMVKDRDPLDIVRALRWKTEIAYASGNLQATARLATSTIKRSESIGYQRGVAYAASRLGTVLRKLGPRRQAEAYTRNARDASEATGDVYLAAESGLALATLLAERGETAGGRHLLDQTIHQIRALNLSHLLPSAMRVALLLAALQANTAEAQVAMSALASMPNADPEVPATLVRWWRQQSDVDRALQVEGPDNDPYGRALWQLERARASISGGYDDLALEEAAKALKTANEKGFAELEIYGRLLCGVLSDVDDDTWAQVQIDAANTLNTETYLGALEMDARRHTLMGRHDEARKRWRSLGGRSEELGYRPGMEESFFWLSDGELTYTGMIK